MTYSNNPHLRRYLVEGGLAHLAVFASFDFPSDHLAERLNQVQRQHPYLDQDEAAARAAYRMLAAQDKRHKKAAPIRKRLGIRFWIIVAAIVAAALLAGYFCQAHAEPTPQQMNAIRNALRGVNLLAGPAPQQPSGIILQLRNGGSTLATRPAGLVVLDCTTNMTCSFSGNTFTLTSTGGGSSAFSALTTSTNSTATMTVGTGASLLTSGTGTITATHLTPAGTLNNCVKWGSSGALADFGAACGGSGSPCTVTANSLQYNNAGAFGCVTEFTYSGSTQTVGNSGILTWSGTGIINARKINNTEFTNGEGLGKIPIGQGDGTAVWADPLVQGLTAHDAPGSTTNPVAIGGFASAAAPTDVSLDTDIVRGWFLRNGSQVMNLASGGTLITLGQKAMTASLPVVFASDQSALPVTGTFWQATQPVSGTFWQATQPVSGTFWQATQPISISQTTTNNDVDVLTIAAGDNNIGNVDIVTLPSVTVGTFPDNEPFNVAQINGVTPLMGNGVTGTGSPRVSIASDNTVLPAVGAGATGSAVPANAVYQASRSTGGNLTGEITCDSTAIYSNTTNGNTELVALTGGQTVRVCQWQISTSQTTAVTVRLVRGTGTACATGETSITPTYTLQAAASTGPIGMVWPGEKFSGIAGASGDAICIETNAAVAVQAMITYVKF